MELQQLKYFCEVAKREHVTRTAEKLFVSQSAISRAVTQLEGELGVPLFYRQGRAVVLSPYGRHEGMGARTSWDEHHLACGAEQYKS
jgi:LysR family transcriptional regulator, transcription activator of glutamate synthase operon